MKRQDYIPNERLLDSAEGSIFKLTMLVAKRAVQLAEGDKVLIEDVTFEKVLEIAQREVEQKKIRVKPANENVEPPEE